MCVFEPRAMANKPIKNGTLTPTDMHLKHAAKTKPHCPIYSGMAAFSFRASASA
jgi:hypothetical protein